MIRNDLQLLLIICEKVLDRNDLLVYYIGMIKNEDWKPIPSEKSEAIDMAITSIFGIDRRQSIEDKSCACCGQGVDLSSFKDSLSLKEFHISGMCQDCQDKVFS